MRKIVLLVLALQLLGTTYAQVASDTSSSKIPEEVAKMSIMIPDRPTASVSSYTVPANTLQLETGVRNEHRKESDLDMNSWMMGTTMLRYGVWKNFELRMGSFYQTSNIETIEEGLSSDTTINGMGPLLLGFKVHIVEEKGIRPQIAITADVTLRHLGSESYAPTYSFPTARFSATHHLFPRLELTYNAGFGYNGENADGFFIYSGLLVYSPTPWLAIFGEAFGSFDHGNLPNHQIDGGLVFIVKNNLYFDLSLGTGFDEDVDEYFFSGGLSWRIPK